MNRIVLSAVAALLIGGASLPAFADAASTEPSESDSFSAADFFAAQKGDTAVIAKAGASNAKVNVLSDRAVATTHRSLFNEPAETLTDSDMDKSW
jgi:hypothetical protein